MKTKQIVWGLLLVLLLYVLSGKSAIATPSSSPTILFLQLLTLLFLLLSLLIFRVKNGMAKKQTTTNVLTVEPDLPETTKTDAKKKLWHELDQTKRDEHIANVCQSSFKISSVVYLGTPK